MNPARVEAERNTSIVMGEMKRENISLLIGVRKKLALFGRGLVQSQQCGKVLLTFSVTIVLLLFFSNGFSQSSIQIIQDVRVDTLVSRYKEVHLKKESIDGFRIQITAGSNRTNIYKVKSKFYTFFPKIKQYLIYQAPNFKLRIGNYRTRLEAYKDLQRILPEFDGAFIINDEIKLSELR